MEKIFPLFFLAFLSCYSINPAGENSPPPDHEVFDKFLKRFVSSDGMVDYAEAIKDTISLASYIRELGSMPPAPNWNTNDKLAYWINLYNASTLLLVMRHYPLKGIKDIGSSIQIPFINTPWQIEFIKVGQEYYDLDNIEHNIIRQNFNKPEIHFALVCAAISCSKLRNEAYKGNILEYQLVDQAQDFLGNTFKNNISPGKIEISPIFRWYEGDFTQEGSLIEFLNKYSKIVINADADISYTEYNWSLNGKSRNQD